MLVATVIAAIKATNTVTALNAKPIPRSPFRSPMTVLPRQGCVAGKLHQETASCRISSWARW